MKKPQMTTFTYPEKEGDMPLGPSSPSGILIENNAGWRIKRPILDTEKCVKCLQCWVLCPEGVIDKEGEVLTIDYDYCKGCGLCANICPSKAINMIKEGDESE